VEGMSQTWVLNMPLQNGRAGNPVSKDSDQRSSLGKIECRLTQRNMWPPAMIKKVQEHARKLRDGRKCEQIHRDEEQAREVQAPEASTSLSTRTR
jgi:hypothetical protein